MSRKSAAAVKSASPVHTLVNPGDADSISFRDGSKHPCAEDHDGPVMIVVRDMDGEVFESLVVVEQAREMYASYVRKGWKRV